MIVIIAMIIVLLIMLICLTTVILIMMITIFVSTASPFSDGSEVQFGQQGRVWFGVQCACA